MKKNSWGFSAIEALLILVVVGIIGGVGWFVWKNNTKGVEKTDNLTSQETANSNPVPSFGYSDRVIFSGSLDEEVRNLGNRIKSFFELVLKDSDNDGSCEKIGNSRVVCKVYQPFLTQKAIAQLEEPRSYSLLACGQMKLLLYEIDEPKITENTATTGLKYLQHSTKLQDATTGQISLVKSDGTWLIDTFSCNP